MATVEPSPGPLRLRAEPLTGAAFAPYGEVVEHAGAARRRYLEAPFDRAAEAVRASLWVSRVKAPVALPLRLGKLERHPFSAQTFIPLGGQRYLVVVTGSRPDGTPDLSGLRAFVAGPSQGVAYRRGVWHHGLSVLDAPAEFAVLMTLTGKGDDDFFWDIPVAVDVHPPENA